MKRDELSVADREVVDVLMRFSDKMPTKGLVRVYLSMHPLVDLESINSYFHRHVVFERNNRYCLCHKSHGSAWQEELKPVQGFAQGAS